VFCGSQKSLVAGIPIASVMFPSTILGAVVLPIMIYHPLQLVVGAWLARRYANQLAAESAPGGTSQATCPVVVA
jgi:sodium/bile acid cotransporter 7